MPDPQAQYLPFDTQLQSLLYEGVNGPAPWQQFVDELRHRSRAHTVTLTFWDPALPAYLRHSITSSGADGHVLRDAYGDRFLAFDPIRYGSMRPGRGYRLEDFISREVFEKSRYFSDFLAPLGIGDIMCLHLVEPGGLKGWLIFGRSLEFGAFAEPDIAWLEQIVTPLEHALSLFANQRRASFESRLYGGVLRNMMVGLISLDETRRLVAANVFPVSTYETGMRY